MFGNLQASQASLTIPKIQLIYPGETFGLCETCWVKYSWKIGLRVHLQEGSKRYFLEGWAGGTIYPVAKNQKTTTIKNAKPVSSILEKDDQ